LKEFKYNFEKLEIWQIAIKLSIEIYKLTNTFPVEEKFGIVSQLRRASNSVSANIAEGVSRLGEKDKRRFIQIAYGSAVEVLSLLILSKELGFMKNEQLLDLRKLLLELTNKLNSFYNSIDK
jgi:four helix bundle protein